MSYNALIIKKAVISAIINNTENSVETAYKNIVDSMKITLSTAEKNTVISEVIANIIHC